MHARLTLTKQLAAAGLVLAFSVAGMAPVAADDTEAKIGQQVLAELQQKGEIIPRPNAYYDTLDPIAARIARVADPQYDYPFTFIMVHETQPNAFAVPGGNVYVTDSLMKFVQNKEELAGVLCHETSHDIHHDVVHNMQKEQTVGTIIGILGALTGVDRSGIGQFGENLAYTLQTNNFSRAVETAADHKGAQTCAQAGFNPWGLIWLFQNFDKAATGGSMEALSDHPTNDHRIADLKTYFRSDPALFGHFSSNIATGTPMSSSSSGAKSSTFVPRRTTKPTVRYCCAPKT